MQNIYPFEINRLRISDSYFTYVDVDPKRLLRLTHLNFIAGFPIYHGQVSLHTIVASGQRVDEKRSATNPQVEQDHKHDRSLDGGNPHMDGLGRHIEIGREENDVTDHDLRKVE